MKKIKTPAEIKSIMDNSGSDIFEKSINLLKKVHEGKNMWILQVGQTYARSSKMNPEQSGLNFAPGCTNEYREYCSPYYWGDYQSMIGPSASWDTDIYEFPEGNQHSNTDYSDGSSIREEWVPFLSFMEAYSWMIIGIDNTSPGYWALESMVIEPLTFNKRLLENFLKLLENHQESDTLS